MMKRLLVIVLLLIVSFSLSAQSLPSSVVGSSGGNFTSSSGSLEWTIGEIMTETYQKTNGFFTQGFHQPSTITVTGVEELVLEEKRIIIYPNPTQDFLYIKTVESGEYLFELFNLQGQQLVNHKSGSTGTYIHQIDVRELRVAMYMLRISNTTTGKSAYHKVEKI